MRSSSPSRHAPAQHHARSRRTKPARRVRRAKSADGLSSALASGAFATLVRYFTVAPERTPRLRALIRETGLGVRSVQMELARMESLGLVHVERSADSRHVVVRAQQLHPAWMPLRALVRALAAPEDVLTMALAGVPHVAGAFIFGSVARGTARADSDCDLMIVTDAEPDEHERVVAELQRRAGAAGDALGRELSMVFYSLDELRKRFHQEHGFVTRVLAGSKRWVQGDAAELAMRLDLPRDAVA